MSSSCCPYDDSYQPPRKNVLLLSCMDLRLLDDIVRFMNHDNLANRYDHIVFAGAALGALGAPGAKDAQHNQVSYKHWKRVFWDHLLAAVTLHHVEDVYILEHRNCGAYHHAFHIHDEFGDSPAERILEADLHRKYAKKLEVKIQKWARKHAPKLKAHSFLMDLRGEVARL